MTLKKVNKYDKQFLIDEFFRYYKENGIYPYKKQMKKSNGYPSEAAYNRIWGTWDYFLKEVKVVSKDNADGWYICDEKILQDMYSEESRDSILNSLMIKRSWSTIVRKANSMGLKRSNKVRRTLSDDFLIDELQRFYVEHGKVPTYDEFEKKSGFPSATVYKKRFGTWNNALEKANLELNLIFKYTKEEVIESAKSFYLNNGRSPYYNELIYSRAIIYNFWSNWTEFLKECDLPLNQKEIPSYTKEESLTLLNDLAKDLNRLPVKSDLDDIGLHKEWYAIRFGSFRNALYEAGLITKEELEIDYETCKDNNIKFLIELADNLQRIPTVQEYELYLERKEVRNYLARETLSRKLNQSYLEICKTYLDEDILNSPLNNIFINKKGEFCKSLPEMNISNLLFDNDIEYKYEPYYNEVMEIENRYQFDWKLSCGDNDIYIEYFGYFDLRKNDYDLVRDYNEKTALKIHLCKENNVNLIDLYSDDLNDNYKGLIEKFSKYGIDIKV